MVNTERKEDMVTPDTRKYWKQLSAIPWSKRGEIRTKLVPWIYTNDHYFDTIVPSIKDSVKKQVTTRNPRVAVLSGVGSLLNIAPYANVDFFVSVDRNSFVLDQVRRMVQNVTDSENRDEFMQESQMSTLFKDLEAMGSDPAPYWQIETESFDKYHFLTSEENYNATRNTLLKTPVYYTQGNFVHRPYVEALGKALEGTDVSYSSFTDLAEWSPEFLDVVSYLPTTEDAVIVWASNSDQPEGKPIAKMSIGLKNYIKEQGDLLHGLSVDYFKPHV